MAANADSKVMSDMTGLLGGRMGARMGRRQVLEARPDTGASVCHGGAAGEAASVGAHIHIYEYLNMWILGYAMI
jgi:hypothetical protein